VSGDCIVSCGVKCNEGESIVSGTTEAEARILDNSGVGEAGVAAEVEEVRDIRDGRAAVDEQIDE